MQDNDWRRAASFLASDCRIDWPCTGERFIGSAAYVEVQEQYPTSTGRWSFDVHRVVSDGDTVVSEVTVTDGEQSARVVAFSTFEGDRVVRQVEYWPIAYDPPPGRDHLVTERIAPVP